VVLHPVGPLPSPVYWRRRLAALAAVGILGYLSLQACGGDAGGSDKTDRTTTLSSLSGGSPGPTPTPSTSAAPTTSPSATATPTVTPAAAAALCTDADVGVTVRADARTYPAGSTPRFTLTVANNGTKPCRRDVGARALELTVTSGPARIWSSDLCKPLGTSTVRTLAAGAKVTTTVSWPRVRRTADCAVAKSTAQPGTYVVVGRAGRVGSPKVVFALH
jgi:hypothetical protein